MKLDKIKLMVKKNTIEVSDKIFASKINKKLLVVCLYKNKCKLQRQKS